MKVKTDVGEHFETVWFLAWKNPEKNHFAIAEEVTVAGADHRASGKRPDVVLYVNGIALGMLELKRSTISVGQGIRQTLDLQHWYCDRLRSLIPPLVAKWEQILAVRATG